MRFVPAILAAGVFLLVPTGSTSGDEPRIASNPNARRPKSDEELRFWLENMFWHHRFHLDEIQSATGMSEGEIQDALARFGITHENRPRRVDNGPLLVLPYPGGRHPRIGFLDGAVDPRRESKISVFVPWDEESHVVVDVPEAIHSRLGLIYLAHVHVPTVWSRQGITLPPLEWKRSDDATLELERTLPNGITFGTRVRATQDAVRMEMWLTNGSSEELSDLRVQNCVMLKGAKGFDQQTNDNKVIRDPYVTCRSADGMRWIITAWEPCHRPWANPPCPCLHSDPKFPDCPPGQTRRLIGWLSFYQGTDLDAELARIDATGWRKDREKLNP